MTSNSPAASRLPLERILFYLLAVVAIVYALLASLRTIAEFDFGWQIATGRWIAQHRQIPSVDVLSYTAAGQPWIYPVGAGLIFYVLYLAGGYAAICWLVALSAASTVALMVRRGSAITAGLAILAAPLIASRASARAEVFTLVLFAATLSILWEQYQTGEARLWLLPVLMAVWVNLHPGFIAGLALLGAYTGIEMVAMMQPARRDAAVSRLRKAWPWLAATCAATLLNPWGWGIYQVILRQQAAMGVHSELILEWAPIPMNWTHIAAGLWPLDPDEFYVLALILVIAVALALARRRIGEAALLGAAIVFPVRHVRMTALFGIFFVVVAGTLLYESLPALRRRLGGTGSRTFAIAGSVLILALAAVRVTDISTGRLYRTGSRIDSFGTGLSWWMPEKAAEFVEEENLPGEIFSGSMEGGFLAWRLGPRYADYIDSRAIPFGTELMMRNIELKGTPPDAALWRQEADRWGIRAVLVPLGRYDALEYFPVLKDFCESESWSAVYLDEVSAVFVRRVPETEALIGRLHVDCMTAPLPRNPSLAGGSEAFHQWANAASVLHALGRNEEAMGAAETALQIFPASGYLHFLRGHMLEGSGDAKGAEQEYLLATRLEPRLTAPWAALAGFYQQQARWSDAAVTWQKTARISRWPWDALESLGYADLMARRPKDALAAFDAAAGSLPAASNLVVDNAFLANIAHGRARCWYRMGDVGRAILYEEQATQLLPQSADLWRQLSELYSAAGRNEDALRARQHAMQFR